MQVLVFYLTNYFGLRMKTCLFVLKIIQIFKEWEHSEGNFEDLDELALVLISFNISSKLYEENIIDFDIIHTFSTNFLTTP